MLKASAGGGGKGMRVARDAREVAECFALATDEAKKSFGDDRLLVEKFVAAPRHVEIQLVADAHGNVACFPERECSVRFRRPTRGLRVDGVAGDAAHHLACRHATQEGSAHARGARTNEKKNAGPTPQPEGRRGGAVALRP